MNIQDYTALPDLALMDAIIDPVLQQFIHPHEVGVITIKGGGINDAQVQALSHGAISNVQERIIERVKQAGIDLERLIGSPEEFDLCAMVKIWPVSQVMFRLHDFLLSKWTQSASALLGLSVEARVQSGTVAAFLAIFVALGFVGGNFLYLYGCAEVI